MDKVDEHKLEAQFKYIQTVKQMKGIALRKAHRAVFKGTKYNVDLVKPHRNLLERRLILLFQMKNYHYPVQSGPRIQFFAYARAILKKKYHPIPEKEVEERDRKEQYKQTELFTKDNINSMSHNQIDRYLNEFGWYIEKSYRMKRKVLWELHRLPWQKLPKTLDSAGKIISSRELNKVRMSNRYTLVDLILTNPMMCYPEFCQTYGDLMPTVSRNSYKVARSNLKKAGYPIPDLRGSTQSVIVKGKKTKRGEKLHDQRKRKS